MNNNNDRIQKLKKAFRIGAKKASAEYRAVRRREDKARTDRWLADLDKN